MPRAALLWIMWVWLFPLAGVLVYLYFGTNSVGLPPHRIMAPPRRGRRPSFDRYAEAVAGTPLRRLNTVRILANGAEGYPAMLAAIAGAAVQVDLQTYIFDLDSVGEAFLEALVAAARRGVRVRVLVDGMGAYRARHPLKVRLRLAGGEARHTASLDRVFRQPLANLRNHRKLLVVDGGLAFTGGLNISQRYAKGPVAVFRDLSAGRQAEDGVRDVHFALEGPITADLARCFQDDWAGSGGKSGLLPARPRGRGHAPGSASGAGARGGGISGVDARVVRSGPDEDLERIYEVLLGALAGARDRVDLCTPYFIPDPSLLAVLRMLGYKGVRVRLFVPRVSDHPYVHWAGQHYYPDLLDAGVEVWEVGRPFIHSKLAVVDAGWVFLGSSNLDIRSFRLNFELNVEAHSKVLAGRLRSFLDVYKADGIRIDARHLLKRPAWKRVRAALVNLAAPYL